MLAILCISLGPHSMPLTSLESGKYGASAKGLRSLSASSSDARTHKSQYVFRSAMVWWRSYDTHLSKERHISPKASNSKIKATRLGGKCYVIATSAWTSRPDVADGTIFGKFSHLYHSDAFDAASHPPLRSGQAQLDPDVVPSCPLCHDTISDHLSHLAQEPLALMDIFCGAGGMSQGFTRTGVATPICGVDISRSCCETFQ